MSDCPTLFWSNCLYLFLSCLSFLHLQKSDVMKSHVPHIWQPRVISGQPCIWFSLIWCEIECKAQSGIILKWIHLIKFIYISCAWHLLFLHLHKALILLSYLTAHRSINDSFARRKISLYHSLMIAQDQNSWKSSNSFTTINN